MSRFSYYDTDEERLPEGMVRAGYDADTQVYTYRDTDGSLWEGAPGAQYGQLTRVSGPTTASTAAAATTTSAHEDYPSAPTEPFLPGGGGGGGGPKSWRQDLMPLLNFLLIIGVFLLGVCWLLGRPSGRAAIGPDCGADAERYTVARGDTCWAVAERRRVGLDDLMGVNKGLDCDTLQAGDKICVPRRAA